MSGYHNLSIYSSDDNPFCPECRNGENIDGVNIFESGGTICFGRGNPSDMGCDGFTPKLEEE